MASPRRRGKRRVGGAARRALTRRGRPRFKRRSAARRGFSPPFASEEGRTPGIRARSCAFPMAALQRPCQLLLLALLRVMPSVANVHCHGHSLQECAQQTGSWTSLWYVWLIMLTVFLLLMCGIGASCVKFCCRRKRPPVQTFPPQAHDLTAIPMDHDSTAHSTVTSYSSIQYPQSIPLPPSFREMDRSLVSPPAYSLYAIELPPSYDEAIKMAKPYLETPSAGLKLDKIASQSVAPEEQNQPRSVTPEEQNQPRSVAPEEQNQPRSVAPEGQNQPQMFPETSDSSLEMGRQLPEASTQGQPQL
uniref:transmembrane protein 52 n=1 Tax=Euleptes europaea TaxID=460621 RepID=UPI0025400125|nr:transmembrane protein 52 [Euleptes europaea]